MEEGRIRPRVNELETAAERGSGYANLYGWPILVGILKGATERRIRWLTKAADDHHVLSAEFLLGISYEHGHGVTPDIRRRFDGIENVEKRHPCAAFSLASLPISPDAEIPRLQRAF